MSGTVLRVRERRTLVRGCWALLALLTAVVSLTADVRAQNSELMFEDAVKAYHRERYDSAAAGFQKLVAGGIDDPRVWHNIGNCYYRMGKFGHALVAYQRGLQLTPRDRDLRANFRFVRLFAKDKIEPVGEFFLERWWQALIAYLSLEETRWLAGLSFWLAALVTAWLLWPGRRVKALAMPLIIVWSIWGLATGVTATTYARDVSSHKGAIVVSQTDVRLGPGEEYKLQFVAHDGLMGEVERAQAGWYLVRFPNGLKGWLIATDFEAI